MKTWWTTDVTITNTYVNNRRQNVNWQYDADGRLLNGNDGYVYDAAGRNVYVETSNLTTATMAYDGDGRQAKTVETWVDENFETQSDTKYYVRSSVLGGQLLAEVDMWGQVSRTFVYAGPAVLGWIWHSYSFDLMVWEQRDPSGATVRGIGEHELDPLGDDAGTFATAVPPTERALVSYGTSHDPANPAMTYSIDGIRMPVEEFIPLAGMKLRDPLGLLEEWARASAEPKGYVRAGVRDGKAFEIITDANRKVVSKTVGKFNPALTEYDFEFETPIYPDAEFDPTQLPKDIPKAKNATPDQQTRFNDAYTEFWKRLHANGGKNSCADLFGGIKKAEKALKDTEYSFKPIASDDAAVTQGKSIVINSNGLFMAINDDARFDLGINMNARQVYYVVMKNIEAAAFILAHEIGHRAGTLQPDGHDQSGFISALNSGKVRDACFADIPTAIELFRPGIQ